MKEFYYPSQGAGSIHVLRWEPEGEVRAVLQIVHGVAEYIERYDEFARYLNIHGILVVGEDHMGHGRSIGEGDTPGYFTGGWKTAVADTYELFRQTKQEFPGVPYYLLGHSMGSFMARSFLFLYPNSGIRGAIIMGTGWQPAPILLGGSAVTSFMVKREGDRVANASVQNLMFGAYNKPFPDAKTSYDWLNTDPEAVERYIADPLCGFEVTNGLARDMIAGLRMIQNRRNLDKMIKTLPVLFVSGDHDPVGDLGKGVMAAQRAFERAGMLRMKLKLYDGMRHEILNEPGHAQVYADILQWIEGIEGEKQN